MECFLHLASLTPSSPESPLPTSLTTALGSLPSLRAYGLRVKEEGAALVTEPQKVNRIGIHSAKTAEMMDMNKLAEYVEFAVRVLKQANAGKAQWYRKRRGPSRDG